MSSRLMVKQGAAGVQAEAVVVVVDVGKQKGPGGRGGRAVVVAGAEPDGQAGRGGRGGGGGG